tara:strand:+ start:563 stop:751 length:189 start_codon:yes stop_codon:yes gene_type:complete
MIKAVRSLKQTARHYQLERGLLGDNKDAPEPLQYWYDVYYKVVGEISVWIKSKKKLKILTGR